MKHKIILGIIVVAALGVGTIWGWFLWTSHLSRLETRKLAETFATKGQVFNQLLDSWERMPLNMSPCGEPKMALGLVHFAVIEQEKQGDIRVARDPVFDKEGFDQSVRSVDEAANLLKVRDEDLVTHLKMMGSVSITRMFQHDAELHFVQDRDSSESLMYVPSSCGQYANYPFWGDHRNASIDQLAPSWFLVQEQQ